MIAALSAKSRKPDRESFGIESSSVLASSRLQTAVLPWLKFSLKGCAFLYLLIHNFRLYLAAAENGVTVIALFDKEVFVVLAHNLRSDWLSSFDLSA